MRDDLGLVIVMRMDERNEIGEERNICKWGVERDYASAFEWWMKAAEQEDVDAQYSLGQYFEFGKGRDIDLVQALFWYQKAEAQGDQWAADAVERIS